VEIEVKIDSSLIEDASAFTTIREYQGFVFALNPDKGIYIFNSLGKHIRTLEVKGTHQFNFLGQELYFTQGKAVKFFDLFTAESREIPTEKPCRFVVLTDERMLLVNARSIDIFDFKP
jgi:hypothetical protein